ncbi:Unknown protein sequence [Pseudomonas amygdali pv. mori]|uniref:Uncharacterized protein n=1 Tax=Pseudomonas amygdali pv. mori TaxID=34065 RepID=A0A0P9V1E9_PSEA0|nr:Unknown protein sequence [Pseudomonas amygdali pv. mori]
MRLVQHLERQAIYQLLKRRIILVAGQDTADRELRAKISQCCAVCRFGILEALQLAHQFVSFVVIVLILRQANSCTQLTDFFAFLGGLERIKHHLADGLGLRHVLGKTNCAFVFQLGGGQGFVGLGIRH